ncbi:MAG: exosortase/archaeosortase family protein [archaeon]|nr:exosortase/archaeosortase family protein [archaeon]
MKLPKLKGPKSLSAKSPLSLKLDGAEARKTGRFVGLFVVVYLILSIGFYAIIPEPDLQHGIAGLTATIFSGEVTTEENPVVSLPSGVKIEISPLCTGMLELFIIVAAILASVGISLKKRAAGAALAAVIIFVLNIFRISFTTLLILGVDSLEVIELAHDLLFRIFLFVSIAAIYIAWFYWAVKSETAKPKQKL